MTWDAIAFKFNQDQLDNMKLLAKELGFDQFQLTLSTKFNKVYPVYPINDTLQPKDDLISKNYRFQREYTHFNQRRPSTVGLSTNLKLYKNAKIYNEEILPLCSLGNKGLFINSQGRLLPCCWVANRYNHNNEWAELSNYFDLNVKTLESVLNDEFWSNDFENFSWTECKTKCNISVVNQQYATEW